MTFRWPSHFNCPATDYKTDCDKYLEPGKRCALWKCPGCGVIRPECFGAADRYAQHCDLCYAVKSRYEVLSLLEAL